MKATWLAVVLLLFVVSLSVKASEKNAVADLSPLAQSIPSKINLNTADVRMLTQSFKGIGKKRAQAIVHYRETQGTFKSVADLAAVRGLGRSFINTHLAELQTVFTVE